MAPASQAAPRPPASAAEVAQQPSAQLQGPARARARAPVAAPAVASPAPSPNQNSHLFRSRNQIPQEGSPIEAPKPLPETAKSNLSPLLCRIRGSLDQGPKTRVLGRLPTQQEAEKAREKTDAERRRSNPRSRVRYRDGEEKKNPRKFVSRADLGGGRGVVLRGEAADGQRRRFVWSLPKF